MRQLCLMILGLLVLSACGQLAEKQPTQPPVLQLTPATAQDVPGTATAYALSTRPTPTPPGLYVVREGDTLQSIAEAFNTTVEKLAATNRISDVNVIYVGQPLIISNLVTRTGVLTPAQQLEPGATPSPSP